MLILSLFSHNLKLGKYIFAAIVLYLAFRIKETFREEKSRGILVAKIAFLIGILFLAGGSFYFFARTLTPPPPPPPPSDENEKPLLALTISYPLKIKINNKIKKTFTITNPTDYTAHGVVIQTTVLFEYFSIISSTHEVIGNVLKIGDVQSGATISSLKLTSPNRPREIRDIVTLSFIEMSEPITQEISI